MIKKEKLESISKSLCLAKWKHLSLHLDRGTGHSCYHNPEEVIPESQVIDNPSSLHNTPAKKADRNLMMINQRPSGCEYCWRQEDISGADLTDRVKKSTSEWAWPFFDRIVNDPASDINPSYLEISFSNTCQLKCSYCGPHNSSSWQLEIERHGNYTGRTFPVAKQGYISNNHLQAFWKWWPQLVGELKIFRITGGEPLLVKETWAIINYLIINPAPNLEIVFNSNLSHDLAVIERLSLCFQKMIAAKAVKAIKIVTSIEAVGVAAQYLRYGINLENFWKNIENLFRLNPEIEISITSTVQALSADSLIEFVNFLIQFRKKFGFNKLSFDPSPILNPEFMKIENLPKVERIKFSNEIEHLINENEASLLSNEVVKLKNLKSVLSIEKTLEQANVSRIQLYKYYSAYDQVRNLNFVTTFPGLKSYWQETSRMVSPTP